MIANSLFRSLFLYIHIYFRGDIPKSRETPRLWLVGRYARIDPPSVWVCAHRAGHARPHTRAARSQDGRRSPNPLWSARCGARTWHARSSRVRAHSINARGETLTRRPSFVSPIGLANVLVTQITAHGVFFCIMNLVATALPNAYRYRSVRARCWSRRCATTRRPIRYMNFGLPYATLVSIAPTQNRTHMAYIVQVSDTRSAWTLRLCGKYA